MIHQQMGPDPQFEQHLPLIDLIFKKLLIALFVCLFVYLRDLHLGLSRAKANAQDGQVF